MDGQSHFILKMATSRSRKRVYDRTIDRTCRGTYFRCRVPRDIRLLESILQESGKHVEQSPDSRVKYFAFQIEDCYLFLYVNTISRCKPRRAMELVTQGLFKNHPDYSQESICIKDMVAFRARTSLYKIRKEHREDPAWKVFEKPNKKK